MRFFDVVMFENIILLELYRRPNFHFLIYFKKRLMERENRKSKNRKSKYSIFENLSLIYI